jgi:predicted ATPase/DNA-binding CsgD family transcriptional regulator
MLHRMVVFVSTSPSGVPTEVAAVNGRLRLPASVSPLIGRHAELDELEAVLGTDRVITLTGPGGCGKSRLAFELALRIGERFDGGVAWVDLASCANDESVLIATATAFELDIAGVASLDPIVESIRARNASLLVLDNAEHVLTAVAELATALSSRAVHATIVSTSREPIGVPGEVVWRVPSLSVPLVTPTAEPELMSATDIEEFASVQLFVERARRSRRGFELTDENATAIAQICARLDGLPLALELAAARIRTMPPDRIARELDDRFRLLAGGPRAQIARQQTLYASVAWSENLLDEGDRAAFRRLGVFVGGFTVAAAEAVISAFDDVQAYDVAEAVSRLVDKSLLQFDDRLDRYSMLETIRSYALQRLIDTGEASTARNAHARWFAAWLRSVASANEGSDINSWWSNRLHLPDKVDVEWPNCAGALRWVAPHSVEALRLVTGLGDYWALRQRATDSATFGMPAVIAGDRSLPEWMDAVVSLQTVRTTAADAVFALAHDEAIAIATSRGDAAALLKLTMARQIAMVMLTGPRADLIAQLDIVRAQAYELRDWYTAWNATQSPAVMLAAAGFSDEAIERVAGLSSTRATLVRALSAQQFGDNDLARRLVARTDEAKWPREVAAFDRVLFVFLAANTSLATGNTAAVDAELAVNPFANSLPFAFRSVFALARGVRAVVTDQYEDARVIFGSEEPFVFTSWRVVCLLAQVEIALGDVEQARRTALRLQALEAPAPWFHATCTLVLAECERDNDDRRALDLAHEALAIAADHRLMLIAVDALETIAVLLAAGSREREAARLLAASAAARTRMGYSFRFAHREQYVSPVISRLQPSDSWSEGATLTIVEAIELAQRMRGGRSRATTGWDAITPTELRVIEHVAAGRTNPQIADALLMSRATVKTHLVHVYAKLGIANRAELAAAVARKEST